MYNIGYRQQGFTIVELLVVVVVIGVLAAIMVVSYTGISQRAVVASLQSDLSNAAQQLKMFNVDNSVYPDTIDCGQADSATNKCLKSSPGNTYSIFTDNTATPQTFILNVTNGTTCYGITDNSAPVTPCPSIPIRIGTQVWLPNNLNVGTMVAATTAQSNNAVLEKHCYNNDVNNCAIYGGLYQWGETVQYLNGASNTSSPSPAFSGNVQGICPIGFHLPTDNEITTLVNYLGPETAGTQLKLGGSSGFEGLLAGDSYSGSFYAFGLSGHFWTSSEYDTTNAWSRYLHPEPTVMSWNGDKSFGMSVRCLKN